MTEQQRRLAGREGSPLATYKQIMVGEGGWGEFATFELYQLMCAGLGSLFGIGLRRIVLPCFLKQCGRGLVVGRNVTIRAPRYISVGRGVVIDDYTAIDVRPRTGSNEGVGLEIGDYVYIGRQSIVSAKFGSVKLGAGCNIGSSCRIATSGVIELGKSVLVAAYVYIGGGNHRTESLEKAIIEQGMDYRGGVKIGENSWIGTRSTIVDGVTVGRDAIVGAHSLVREDVPDRAIVAGCPAKLIKYRE